jgi:hypothetical protein
LRDESAATAGEADGGGIERGGGAAAYVALPGCDDPHQADRRVRDTIVQARLERAKGTPGSGRRTRRRS